MIRSRVDADLSGLVDVLLAQRAGSGYPVSLPDDPVDLIQRDHEVGAWVWGDGLGHVSVTRFPAEADLSPSEWEEATSYARAHGCCINQLGVVAALFIAEEFRGQGIGKRLCQHAVDACRAAGLRPCLDVVVSHGSALAMYQHLGWQVVDEIAPSWLPDGMGPVVTMILPEPF